MLTNINIEVFSNKEDFMYIYFLITVSEHSISLKIVFSQKWISLHSWKQYKRQNEFETGKKCAFKHWNVTIYTPGYSCSMIDTDFTF